MLEPRPSLLFDMASPHEPADATLLDAQGDILETLATGVVLTGTLDDLGQRFGLPPEDLRRCLRALVAAGWIAVRTLPAGQLTARSERRTLSLMPGCSCSCRVARRRGTTGA